jgi:hypothetical protein
VSDRIAINLRVACIHAGGSMAFWGEKSTRYEEKNDE